MATKAALRRLNYILNDEEYGPKLARLRGEEERRILALIDENKGKDARAAILEADERRRAKGKRVTNREQLEEAAVANIMRQYGRKASRATVQRNVGYMTIAELDFAKDATESGLIGKARKLPERRDSRGKEVNPFWYH